MDLSIIICTRNRADSLRQTLESIRGVEIPQGMQAEFLLVDNGSTDHTRQVVEGFQFPGVDVRYIHEPEKGLSRARNRALQESKGDILLWTDDDVRVPVDWVEGMTRPIRTAQAHAVAGGVKLAPHLERPWMTKVHKGWLASTEGMEGSLGNEPSSAVGANIAFTRHLVDSIGEFDKNLGAGALGSGEETAYMHIAIRSGFRIAWAEGVQVIHHPDTQRICRSSFQDMAKQRGVSLGYMYRNVFGIRVKYLIIKLVLRYMLMNMLTSISYICYLLCITEILESELSARQDYFMLHGYRHCL